VNSQIRAERILKALALAEVDRAPYWLFLEADPCNPGLDVRGLGADAVTFFRNGSYPFLPKSAEAVDPEYLVFLFSGVLFEALGRRPAGFGEELYGMLVSNPESVVEKIFGVAGESFRRLLLKAYHCSSNLLDYLRSSDLAVPVFLAPSILLPADFVATVLRGHWNFAVDARRRRGEVEEALNKLFGLELEALDVLVEVWRSLERVYRGVPGFVGPFIFVAIQLAEVFRPETSESLYWRPLEALIRRVTAKGVKALVYCEVCSEASLERVKWTDNVDGVVLWFEGVEPAIARRYVKRAAVAGGVKTGMILPGNEPEVQARICEFLQRNRGVRGFIFTGASMPMTLGIGLQKLRLIVEALNRCY